MAGQVPPRRGCAGKPTAVFPSNLGDQLFWGRRVHALGAGPVPVPQKRLTVERLIGAIHTVTENVSIRCRAAELGEEIRAEDGIVRAIEEIVGRTPERSFARQGLWCYHSMFSYRRGHMDVTDEQWEVLGPLNTAPQRK